MCWCFPPSPFARFHWWTRTSIGLPKTSLLTMKIFPILRRWSHLCYTTTLSTTGTWLLRLAMSDLLSTFNQLHVIFRFRSDLIYIPFEHEGIENHSKLLHYNRKLFEISVGPTIHSTGIKACLTYNPPGPNYPGYQRDRTVSKLILVKDDINLRVCQGL